MTPEAWKLVFVGVGVLLDTALACALGYYGKTKGYPFFLCFMLGLFTSPIVGWIIIALLPEREQKYRPPPALLLAIELEKAKMAKEQRAAT